MPIPRLIWTGVLFPADFVGYLFTDGSFGFVADATAQGWRYVCVGPDGYIYGSARDGTVARFDAYPQVIGRTLAGEPYGMCAGPDYNLWLNCNDTLSTPPGTVSRMTLSGVVTNFGINDILNGICLGPDDNLYVCGFSGNIYQVTPLGAITAFPVVAIPQEICLGSYGYLYFTDVRGFVWKITTSGVAEIIYSGLNQPLGICLGPDDYLWVCDSGNDRICRFPQR